MPTAPSHPPPGPSDVMCGPRLHQDQLAKYKTNMALHPAGITTVGPDHLLSSVLVSPCCPHGVCSHAILVDPRRVLTCNRTTTDRPADQPTERQTDRPTNRPTE
jgi:hypothetical protein